MTVARVIYRRHVHGYAHLPFDHYTVPQHIWARLERIEGDHWLWRGAKDVDPRMVLASRLGVVRSQVLALVPTCGLIDCANPAHTCLTTKSEE